MIYLKGWSNVLDKLILKVTINNISNLINNIQDLINNLKNRPINKFPLDNLFFKDHLIS